MRFIDENLNPTGRKHDDCVVRAIMKATEKTWLEIYDALCETGREIKEMPSNKKAYSEWLEQNGWKKMPMPRNPDRTRYTVEEFADEHPKGRFIISVARHLTVVVDGTLYDTWDCSQKSLGNYWRR